MREEDRILNALFNELGVKDSKATKGKDTRDYKGKWPLFEVKGSFQNTWDMFESLETATKAIQHSRLHQYEIWQINEAGIKICINKSHNEAGFKSNSFSILQGFVKHD